MAAVVVWGNHNRHLPGDGMCCFWVAYTTTGKQMRQNWGIKRGIWQCWHATPPCDYWLLLVVYCISFWVACWGSRSPSWPLAMWIMGATEKNLMYSIWTPCRETAFPPSLVFLQRSLHIKTGYLRSSKCSLQVVVPWESPQFHGQSIQRLHFHCDCIQEYKTLTQLWKKEKIKRKRSHKREVNKRMLRVFDNCSKVWVCM